MATPATGIEAHHRLDELYRAHASDIYRYVYAVLGNRADAEDVMQTTFVNALRALERGELPRKPENWLITIAHNLIRQRFRQQNLRPRQVELDAEIPTLETDDSGPSIDDLVRALQRIPETQREALVLRELDGRPYKEIAAILDISVSALQTLLFRARRSLAEELENLVTCDRAELALSQDADGRLGRKERRRLAAHLKECPSCTRVAAVAMKRRRAFKGLAVLPLPWSLTFFRDAPSASAAIGLPTIGSGAAAGGTAAGVVGGGIAAKVAIGFAAVAVAGGAGYEGVKAVSAPAPATAAAAAAVVAAAPDPAPIAIEKRAAQADAATAKPGGKKPRPVTAAAPKAPAKGRSATAPGHTKPKAAAKPKLKKAPKTKAVAPAQTKSKKPKPVQAAEPKAAPGAAKSAEAKSKPASTPKPKELIPPAELPEPPALPRGPQNDEVLPELARDRLKGPRP